MAKFNLVRTWNYDGESWDGFYANGKLVAEDHHLEIREILDALRENGVDVEYHSFKSNIYFEASGYCHFPDFEQVKPYLEEEK